MSPEFLRAALDAGDVACLLMAGADPSPEMVRIAREKGVAVLVDGDQPACVELAQKASADGIAYLSEPCGLETFVAVRAALGTQKDPGTQKNLGSIAIGRHDAMELAEAGADFVAFDVGTAAGAALLAWWADVAQTPMVAVSSATVPEDILKDAKQAAELEAEFFAFGLNDAHADLVRQVDASLRP